MTALQFLGHSYLASYDSLGNLLPGDGGSNIQDAQKYTLGSGVIGVIDTGLYENVISNVVALNSIYRALPDGGHGTEVSSVISGSPGIVNGVAPGALLAFYAIPPVKPTTTSQDIQAWTLGLSALVGYDTINSANNPSIKADVVNISLGLNVYGSGNLEADPSLSNSLHAWYEELDSAVLQGRGGKGTVIVFSAGNSRYGEGYTSDTPGANVDLQSYKANPDTIIVAATLPNGNPAGFSTFGASILVSAIGKDITVAGFSDKNPTPNPIAGHGQGTSVSTPIVSAIVDLMLSVNVGLKWFDIQEILAVTAYMPPAVSVEAFTNKAVTNNGGGYHFSNDLGFGVVDAAAAVNLAKIWIDTPGDETPYESVSSQIGFTAPSGGSLLTGYPLLTTDNIFVGNQSGDGLCTHVVITINDTNLLVAYSKVVLKSPSGTESVIYDRDGFNKGIKFIDGGINFNPISYDQTNGLDANGIAMMSNAFWGETSYGNWTLEVYNSNTSAALISSWSISISNDALATGVSQPLVYTPEFALLASQDPTRTVVNQGGGATVLDLIDLTAPTYLYLDGSKPYEVLDGVAVSVVAGINQVRASGVTGSLQIHMTDDAFIPMNEPQIIQGGDGDTSIWGGSYIPNSGKSNVIHAGLGNTFVQLTSYEMLTFDGGAGATVVADAAGGSLTAVLGNGGTVLEHVAQTGASLSSPDALDFISGFVVGRDVFRLTGYSSSYILEMIGDQADGSDYASALSFSTDLYVNFQGLQSISVQDFGFESLAQAPANGTVTAVGSAGANYYSGGTFTSLLTELSGIDTIVGGQGVSTITLSGGSADINLLASFRYNEDFVTNGLANVTITQGAGNLTLNLGTGSATVLGGAGSLLINGVQSTGDLSVVGGSGKEVIYLGEGDAIIQGGSGDIVLATSQIIPGGELTYTAGGGNATIVGGQEDVTIVGGAGRVLFDESAGLSGTSLTILNESNLVTIERPTLSVVLGATTLLTGFQMSSTLAATTVHARVFAPLGQGTAAIQALDTVLTVDPDGSLDIVGSVAQVNAALDTLKFTDTTANTPVLLFFSATDGGLLSGANIEETFIATPAVSFVPASTSQSIGYFQLAPGVSFSSLTVSFNAGLGTLTVSDATTSTQASAPYPGSAASVIDAAGNVTALAGLVFGADGIPVFPSGDPANLQITLASGQTALGGTGATSFVLASQSAAVGGTGANTFSVDVSASGATIVTSVGSTNSVQIIGSVTAAAISQMVDDATGDVSYTLAGSPAFLTVRGDMSMSATGVAVSAVQSVSLADGESLPLTTFDRYDGQNASAMAVAGTRFGNSVLHLTSSDMAAVGGSGGSNTFIDAPGQHTVTGGLHGNTYVFHANDGSFSISAERGDSLVLGAGITAASLALSVDTGGDLSIGFAGSSDLISIHGDLSRAGSTVASLIPTLTFSDGSTLAVDQSFTYSQTVSGGASVLASVFGKNAFQFGIGGGTAVGGTFASTYLFGSGDGHGFIRLGSGTNTLSLGPNLTAANLTFTSDTAGDETISINGSSDALEIFADLSVAGGVLSSGISSVAFSNGTSIAIDGGIHYAQTVSGGASISGSAFGQNVFIFGPGGGTAVGAGFGNTFNFASGNGACIITNPVSSVLNFGAGITASMLAFSVNTAGDLTISVSGTSDSLTIRGEFALVGGAVTSRIPQISFSDGSTLPLGSNLIYSYTVSGGASVTGSLFGGNTFTFGAGGGTAVGGGFPNSFKYLSGDGSAVITPGTTSDTLVLGAGITASMLTYASDPAGDLTITIGAAGDFVTLVRDLSGTGAALASKVAKITYSDGTSTLINSSLTYGQSAGGGATVTGSSSGTNLFQFAPGGGTAVGGTGQNTYVFGLGDGASIVASTTNGTIKLEAGITTASLAYTADAAGDLTVSLIGTSDSLTINHELSVNSGGTVTTGAIPSLTLSTGSVIYLNQSLTFNHTVGGGASVSATTFGQNLFTFAAGGGTAIGGTYAATYVFGLGDGASVISSPAGGTIKLATGITAANLVYTADAAGDLTVGIIGTPDSLTINHELSVNSGGTLSTGVVSSLTLSTGTSIYLNQSLVFNHTVGGGATVNPTIFGQNLYQFTPGGGTAVGGTFASTYLFGQGDGADVISSPAGGTIKLAAGITAANLIATADVAGDLTLTLVGTSDSLTIDHELTVNPGGTATTGVIPSVSLSTGTVVYLNQTLSYAHTVGGGASVSATVFGQNVYQFAAGGGTANGGTFANSYLFGTGDGASVISSGTNGTVTLGAGITAANLAYTADTAGDLTISVTGSSDTLTINHELTVNSGGTATTGVISYLSFSNGAILNLNQTLTYNHTVGGGASVSATTFGQNLFQFAAGGGTAVGGTFASTYLFGAGDGASVISTTTLGTIKLGSTIAAANLSYAADAAGDLTVSVIGTSDTLTINHELSLNSGGTVTTGAIAALTLSNGSSIYLNQSLVFNHTVGGGVSVSATAFGQNVYQFAAGGGTAVAGSFANTYLFGAGDGASVISAPTSGTVKLAAGITAANLLFSSDTAGDLTIGLTGSTDTLTIKGELTSSGTTVTGGIPSLTLSTGATVAINNQTLYTEKVSGGASVTGSSFGNNDMQFAAGGGTATGGRFSNTFEYGEGDGVAQITPTSLGIVKLGSGITSSNLWFDKTGNDLTVTVMDGQTDKLVMSGWFVNSPQTLQSVIGSDSYKIDSGIGNLVSAMATYESQNPGFSASAATVMPTNTTLHNAIVAAWHT